MQLQLTLTNAMIAQLEFLKIYYGYHNYNELLNTLIINYVDTSINKRSIKDTFKDINNSAKRNKMKQSISINKMAANYLINLYPSINNTDKVYEIINYYMILICINLNYYQYRRLVEYEKEEPLA